MHVDLPNCIWADGFVSPDPGLLRCGQRSYGPRHRAVRLARKREVADDTTRWSACLRRVRVVFIAGQVGWDPATSEFHSDQFSDQVRQALKNVVTALAAAGARPDPITRLVWYITDRDAYLSDQREIGASYREIIGPHFPAMSVVVVRGLIEARAGRWRSRPRP